MIGQDKATLALEASKMSIAEARNEILRAIQAFCISNDLSYDKVLNFPQSFNQNVLAVQYWDKTVGAEGLLDETPAEIILLAKKTGEKIIVEKCDNTDKYLGF